MGIFSELMSRGLFAQLTDSAEVENLLDSQKIKFYVGFDPTADSLHIGHFVQIIVISHLQKTGHVPIILFGGGTGLIGDPSGKSDMRKMLSKDQIQHNIDNFKAQVANLIDLSPNKAILVNNADWLSNLNYVDFLREIGPCFSVNRMLTAECYRQRMQKGLTFLEFNYMLMQAYDFLTLNRQHQCILEIGGDDQWSNIIAGVELIRRKERTSAYGATTKLLTTSEGKKMGKTEKGAIWLNPEKTSVFDFYQYWRNIADADVLPCLKMLTFIPLEKISEFAKLKGSEINLAKEILAYEITKLVHGKTAADNAQSGARAIFSNKENTDNMPCTEINEKDFSNGCISIIDLLKLSKLINSNGEGRRLIDQGGISVNGEKITNISHLFKKSDISQCDFVIKKGKKIYHKVKLV